MTLDVLDWQRILAAYIWHVGECEGTDFLLSGDIDLPPHQLAALLDLGATVNGSDSEYGKRLLARAELLRKTS